MKLNSEIHQRHIALCRAHVCTCQNMYNKKNVSINSLPSLILRIRSIPRKTEVIAETTPFAKSRNPRWTLCK